MKPHHGEMQISSSEGALSLLQAQRFGHLGCYAKGEIYVVPVTYIVEDGFIYSHSRPGKKIEMMRASPHVCLQVEEVRDFHHWRSAIAWGRFEELTGDAAAMAMHLLLRKFLEYESPRRVSSLEVDMSAILETAIIFRIKIEKITGRFERSEPHKGE